MRRIAKLLIVPLGLLLNAGAAQAQYGSHDHGSRYRHNSFVYIDELAIQMQNDASRVCWEMFHHFRAAPGYRVIYREAYEMYTTSRYIHSLAHHGAQMTTVRRTVQGLDGLFHHLEGDFRGLKAWSESRHRHVSTAHLRTAMSRMNQTLHALYDAVGLHDRGAPPPVPPEQLKQPVPGQPATQPGVSPSPAQPSLRQQPATPGARP